MSRHIGQKKTKGGGAYGCDCVPYKYREYNRSDASGTDDSCKWCVKRGRY
jgi:hypothetical protein